MNHFRDWCYCVFFSKHWNFFPQIWHLTLHQLNLLWTIPTLNEIAILAILYLLASIHNQDHGVREQYGVRGHQHSAKTWKYTWERSPALFRTHRLKGENIVSASKEKRQMCNVVSLRSCLQQTSVQRLVFYNQHNSSKDLSDLKCLSGSNQHISDVLLMMHICPYMH